MTVAGPQRNDPADSLFDGGGEMGRRMQAFDWSRHPLGLPAQWPQSLRTTIRIMLTSRYAMWLGWGPEFWFFCNDAYLPTVGIKESWVLGASARKVWAEIWADIGPRAESVVATGQATWDEGLRLFLERSGAPEETYHTFSYSPLPDDRGGTGGMLCVVTEETERRIAERRMAFLRDLAAELAKTNNEPEVLAGIERQLAAHPSDVPFALLYLFEEDGARAKLAAAAGIGRGHPLAPEELIPGAGAAPWPAAELLARGETLLVPDLAGWKRERMPALPKTAWFDLAPDWVCEILSPGTARLDRVQKMPIYAESGVEYLWLVDPELRTLEAYRREGASWLLLGSHADQDIARIAPFDAIELVLGLFWA